MRRGLNAVCLLLYQGLVECFNQCGIFIQKHFDHHFQDIRVHVNYFQGLAQVDGRF